MTAKALPGPAPSKRDLLRAYLKALIGELFDKGLIKPTDTPSAMLATLRRHVVDEIAADATTIIREDVAPRLMQVGANAVMRSLFGNIGGK